MTIRAKVVLLLAFVVLACSISLWAGPKVVTNNSKSRRIVKKEQLPKGNVEIKVGEEEYYAYNGIFYKKYHKGYRVVKAPRGAKIKRIPDGFRIVRKRGIPYYVYYHTWYRYDEIADIYIVVDFPDGDSYDYYDDKLYMVNGSVLVGRYMGGSDEHVKFRFNDETERIPLEDIISIEFAAAMD